MPSLPRSERMRENPFTVILAGAAQAGGILPTEARLSRVMWGLNLFLSKGMPAVASACLTRFASADSAGESVRPAHQRSLKAPTPSSASGNGVKRTDFSASITCPASGYSPMNASVR